MNTNDKDYITFIINLNLIMKLLDTQEEENNNNKNIPLKY